MHVRSSAFSSSRWTLAVRGAPPQDGLKRQDDLTCDEEPWCLSGSDSPDERSELDGDSEASDFSPIMATIDQRFLVVRTSYLPVKRTKVTWVLYMWCFLCLRPHKVNSLLLVL